MFNLYLIIGALAAIIGAFFYGMHIGAQGVKTEYITEYVKVSEERNEREQEVITLPRPALKSRYCRWVRDSRDDCMQADIPVE